ncbi:PREDICTED: sterol 26-hydroxylase, mitochondrial [Gavialis gangeticus]|uniref:sterol 26-hydroxylase, mitochondrial n=1 Tax=Gavialis gangeticus TaxID=94835 RepID=UPI00092E6D72|nr:PREDICTED: sterol 26-hydroxylase, mitochondrial [Gavialis gangeticus]
MMSLHRQLRAFLWARAQGPGLALAKATVGTTVPGRLKSLEELPGPGVLRCLYWYLLRGYLLHMHDLQGIFKQHYGSLWKQHMGPYMTVNVACPELLEQVLRQEGRFPTRCDMALWKEHRDLRGQAYGPLTEDGERWHRLRQVLNRRMLKPTEAVLYTGTLNAVTSDLLGRLEAERRSSPSGQGLSDVASLLYRFALEGIASILFETRIGCLEPQVPPETQRFIDAIGCMFRDSVFVTALPAWTRALLPFWDRYLRSWDTIFAFGKKLIDRRMEELAAQQERGQEASGYLSYLLACGHLTPTQVYGSVAELLLAGVDTTSNTLSWALYHLARDPQAQADLHREVTSVVGGQVPDAPHLAQMPLLKAIIKETLRLYPVVQVNSRVAVEKDIIVGDYLFPKGTLISFAHFTLSRDERSFPEPERFLPQRWLRAGATPHHPFSSIPFGYGIRGCVGRRIAELEMYLALARVSRGMCVHMYFCGSICEAAYSLVP